MKTGKLPGPCARTEKATESKRLKWTLAIEQCLVLLMCSILTRYTNYTNVSTLRLIIVSHRQLPRTTNRIMAMFSEKHELSFTSSGFWALYKVNITVKKNIEKSLVKRTSCGCLDYREFYGWHKLNSTSINVTFTVSRSLYYLFLSGR